MREHIMGLKYEGNVWPGKKVGIWNFETVRHIIHTNIIYIPIASNISEYYKALCAFYF